MHTKFSNYWVKEQALVGLHMSTVSRRAGTGPHGEKAEAGDSVGHTVGVCSHPPVSFPCNRASIRTSVSAGRPLECYAG